MMAPITREKLSELLSYDPETGIFTWRISQNTIPAGAIAGSLNVEGYVRININGKRRMAHQLAWLYVHGEPANSFLDHINGSKADNRIANLRKATRQENQFNRGAPKHSKSGLKGVYFRASRNKWIAKISIDRRRVTLGQFLTRDDAHRAYTEAALKLHGEFARLA